MPDFWHTGYHDRLAQRKKRVRYHLPVLIEQDEDGMFIVSVPTLRGCRSYGRTVDEAMENIAEAAALCLEDETPPPSSGVCRRAGP